MQLFDIPMPKCTPKEICNIQKVSTVFDASPNGIRWQLLLSLEPKDRFLLNNVHTAVMNDVFYKKLFFRISASVEANHSESFVDFPFAYPYETLRMGLQQSSVATGSTWNILIYYTIEAIDTKQLTAITIRRGTVRHARPQGPEP